MYIAMSLQKVGKKEEALEILQLVLRRTASPDTKAFRIGARRVGFGGQGAVHHGRRGLRQ